MIHHIISFSIKNKLIILLFTMALTVWGIFSLQNLSIGSVPDITSNQVQVITVSRNLATEEVEKFITYPVELSVANLPGVEEIRSTSKFGLSRVTVVFEEDMGTYLPRQLISEKLKQARQKIPEGFGIPEMAPISTGLGEIYQYTLETKPGFDTVYSAMDLREIQDWIIKRQLAGTEGVVEVNTWGGYLKQYEVAVDPERLRNMNISLLEVFEALKQNNENTGGAYIEKNQTSYFIRASGMVENLSDIRSIVIKVQDGIPVKVEDVATVQFGYATRFGAITGNGEGEKVMGQVMMLKGANPYAVITRVKEKMAEIEKTLPEGVYINGFLDRSDLIEKTTSTVEENLILGALFVVFVLVLLMGNLRSGLIVASVIPLSLLFGISLMNLFKVDANLLSLGAIDFGILIDGAVIIVEYVVYQMTKNRTELQNLEGSEYKNRINSIAFKSSNKMMNSAIFGQIIILIVFIPILTFTGIEGKMFRPMALTFMFILLGAMILCLTYVPVMSALFIRPPKTDKKNISDKIIGRLHKLYEPVLYSALRHYRVVISLAILSFGMTSFIFYRLGGEFLPTLDEGDYVIQPVLKPGTALSQTIEITTKIEKVLLEEFPDEVEQVVSRIGAAEIPTDPMSMEMTDIIIKLKDPDGWSRADNKKELSDLITEELSVIPGVTYQFTQPIEMRFNELLTGVRADLAVKIYGDDLQTLYNYGIKASNLIQNVDGVDNVSVEQIVGLPQITIDYDREKMAVYGVSIKDVNKIVRTAFSGSIAGVVFEKEKRFGLALRLERDEVDIDVIRNLSIKLPAGGQVLLNQMADIEYKSGPSQISRDNTRRRIVVSVNNEGRDIESIVEEIRPLLSENLNLPSGYSVEYGGQFENLNQARNRLLKVVPLALLLIFVLLYFTFRSFSESLMVFISIPLATIGGVLALWARDMPFSISAGIGFIALFGIAVLNGIVLISYFNDLEKNGITDIKERIMLGCKDRLRPVLLTASTDILGFIPMAVSMSAGAEVQRPLATVVIGGLISAFFLTLLVLPVVYYVVKTKKVPRVKKLSIAPLIILLFLIPDTAYSQENVKELTPEEAWNLVESNNSKIKAYQLEQQKAELLKSTAWNVQKTLFFLGTEENEWSRTGDGINSYGIQQNLDFPGVYVARKKWLEKSKQIATEKIENVKLDLKCNFFKICYELVYLKQKKDKYAYLDSLYNRFSKAAAKRFSVGSTNKLESIMAQAKYEKIHANYVQIDYAIEAAYAKMQSIIQTEDSVVLNIKNDKLTQGNDTLSMESHPAYRIYSTRIEKSMAEEKVKKNSIWPGLYFQYVSQTVNGRSGFFGYQAGLRVPLWFGPDRARQQAAQVAIEQSQAELEELEKSWAAEVKFLFQQYKKAESHLSYFEDKALTMAEMIQKTAKKSYDSGEIDFLKYIESLEYAVDIELEYLEALNQYNQAILDIRYYSIK